jgi:hypothetical protein
MRAREERGGVATGGPGVVRKSGEDTTGDGVAATVWKKRGNAILNLPPSPV